MNEAHVYQAAPSLACRLHACHYVRPADFVIAPGSVAVFALYSMSASNTRTFDQCGLLSAMNCRCRGWT